MRGRLAFIFRTDVHASEHSPESWKGDYPAEIWSSLEQIGELARAYSACAVLDGGDFFHIKAPTQNSHRLVAKVAALHQAYPCKVFCIEGNHDIKHNNLETLSDQPLGVLYNARVFEHLRDQTFTDSDVRVRVVGVPYSPFRTVDELRAIRKQDDEVLIAIVHALAGQDPPASVEEFYGEPVFRYEDLVVDEGPDIWCFPPGTPILDHLYGVAPIESIAAGSAVQARNGTAIVEQQHPARKVSEDLVYLDMEGLPRTSGATAEHPYWVAKGMQCSIPSRSGRRCHPDKERQSKPCAACAKAPRPDPRWCAAGRIETGDYVGIPVPALPHNAPPPELGLARLLGYYAAEGHVLLNRADEPVAGVVWSFHTNEVDLQEDVRALVRQHFGLDVHLHETTGSCAQVCAYGRSVSDFFVQNAGRYSASKRLSEWLWNRGLEDRLEFLIGWLRGDGHARANRTDVSGATASESLAYQIYFLALSVGLRPCLRIHPPAAHQNYPTHKLSFYGDEGESLSRLIGVVPPERTKSRTSGFFHQGLYFVRVREVSRRKYEGLVHNFRTTTGEYVAGGALVHNCFGHWHQDQGIAEVRGRWFINQGAVSRGSLSKENLGRTPKVAVIEVTEKGIAITPHELQVAAAAEVFDLERKKRQDKESSDIEEYVARIRADLLTSQGASIDDAIGGLDFAREIHDLALAYLQQARARKI